MTLQPTEQWFNREDKLVKYLKSLKDEAIAINDSENIILKAYSVWSNLRDTFFYKKPKQILEVPDCCPNTGSQGEFHIMFTWTKDEHYLECEIFNNGDIEFFYRNRIMPSEGWGEDYTIGQTFSEDLIDKLSLFVE